MTRNLRSGFDVCVSSIRSNIALFSCGMIPGFSFEPVIENDFPDPVWPYAKMVPFQPSNALERRGAPRFRYTSGCTLSSSYA